MTVPTLFGDYSLIKARGRWIGTCYHCAFRTKPKSYPGHVEASVRQHLQATHSRYGARRDARETWLR